MVLQKFQMKFEVYATKHALKSFVGTFFALQFSLRFIWANEVPFSPADSSFTKILLLAFI